MQLRSFTAAALLSVLFAGSPPAGCQPVARCGPPLAHPQPVAYEAEDQPRPPKPKPDRKKNNCTKSNSPQWKSFQPYRGDIKTNGESGKQRRFYTWDHTHNDIEVWNPNGDHLGSMDPATGKMIKPAKSDRDIRDKLK